MPETAEDFSNFQPFRYIYGIEKFKMGMCGLDINKNFIHTDKLYDDDCFDFFQIDHQGDEKDIKGLGCAFLSMAPYERAGVFVLNLNGIVYFFLHNEKMGDNAECYHLKPKIWVNKDYYALGKFAKAEQLDCYGLLVEIDHGIYMVVEQ